MLSKNEVKDIQSLNQKKQRDQLNLFLAEGPKIIDELIQLIPTQIEKIFATKEWMTTNNSIIGQLNVLEVSDDELKKISQLQTPNQVLAICSKWENKPPIEFSFAIYLDAIQDPGNLGTIMRIADWFDIKNIICSEGCADMYNPKLVQATMGSIARVNIYADLDSTWLSRQRVPVFAATLNGKPLHLCHPISKGILIIGNESKGIRKEYLDYATEKITIEKKGNAESLNAAVATGIILSHLLS